MAYLIIGFVIGGFLGIIIGGLSVELKNYKNKND